ncbi:IS200/IS605 family transposase, partial [Syntrophorhabdus aromaticivorans]|uniref:IS200/IS605 family transposase n=1 Tax=Syntrophorhabdus aromaticivorans TaxID=328301 RepID=UPI0012EB8CA1
RAVYDTKYHLVWAPKYRKWVLRDAIRDRVEELLKEIAQHHGFEIEEMEIAMDHIHIFSQLSPTVFHCKGSGYAQEYQCK